MALQSDSSLSWRDIRAATWRQELERRPWRNAAYRLAQLAFLCTSGPLSRDGTAPSGVGPSISIISQENVPEI